MRTEEEWIEERPDDLNEDQIETVKTQCEQFETDEEKKEWLVNFVLDVRYGRREILWAMKEMGLEPENNEEVEDIG